MLWITFSCNIENSQKHHVYFKSYRSLYLFTDQYQFLGGIKQFDYDIVSEIPNNSSINKLSFKNLFKQIINN